MWYNFWEIDKWREPLRQFADLVFIRLLKLMAVVAMVLGGAAFADDGSGIYLVRTGDVSPESVPASMSPSTTAPSASECSLYQKESVACPANYSHAATCEKQCGGDLRWKVVVVTCEPNYRLGRDGLTCTQIISYTHLVGRACQNPVPLPAHAPAGRIVENSLSPYGIACGVTACADGWHVDTRNHGQCLRGAGTQTTASCDAGLFMVASGNQCACMPNYEWRDPNNHALGCVESTVARLKQECAAAGETTWNEETSVCTCNDTNYEYNTDTKTCTETELYAQCQSLVSAGQAEWDDASKVCTCTQTNYLFSNGQCIEDPAIVAARNAENARVAKQKIENVHAKLKRKQDTFKVSAWKDADGQFNTARLASDSIAGAAVGAVGGLLINKHVKKNQVEDGFEALGCTVKGETVAQWGEEFSIDIKK
jgi:hypothetical protein